MNFITVFSKMLTKYLYLPPARSKLKLFISVVRFILRNNADFHGLICKQTGNHEVITGSSWVHLFASLLIVLKKKHPTKNQVILARHSCYEFTDAILSAGLTPVYIDVSVKMEYDFDNLREFTTNSTLGIISICNVGLYNNLHRIKDYCCKMGIYHFEDSTYTLGGINPHGNYGSFGDFSIYNFSEGKAIPIGGGGLGINNISLTEIFNELNIVVEGKNNEFSDIISLLRYKTGSSTIGFSLYKLLYNLIGMDLKRKFAMEPTRRNEDFKFNVKVRNISVIKKNVGYEALRNLHLEIKKRHEKYHYLMNLAKLKTDSCFFIGMYTHCEMIIKVPVVLRNVQRSDELELSRYGVIRLYGKDSKLHNKSKKEFINSNNFYCNLFTIPIYGQIRKSEMIKILDVISKYVYKK